MFDYLQKFNKLPPDIKNKVSSAKAMAVINDLENQYGIELAIVVMRVMVKEIDINNLGIYLAEEYNLSQEKSEKVVNELKTKIFQGLGEYLGFEEEIQSFQEDEKIDYKPPKASPPSPKASFFFSSEDEEEIRELSQKIEDYVESRPQEDYNKRVEEVVGKSQVQFGSQAMNDRLKTVVKTYLRGIRDKIETKQTLIRPQEDGGLGLEEEQARAIIKIADESPSYKASAHKAPPKVELPEDRKAAEKEISIARDADYDLSQLKKEPVSPSNIPSKQEKTDNKEEINELFDLGELDLEHELAPPPPAIKPKEEQKKTEEKPKEVKKIEIKKAEDQPRPTIKIDKEPEVKIEKPKGEIEIKKPEKEEAKQDLLKKPMIKIRKPVQASGKRRMDDVKYVPKVMSPIDELRYMNLVNFRRLNSDPQKAKERILEKINILAEEKYSKRLEGIKAWRQSPLNKLYLQIGQESIAKNSPVEDVMAEMKSEGKDYLTNDEFEAILELNREIRF